MNQLLEANKRFDYSRGMLKLGVLCVSFAVALLSIELALRLFGSDQALVSAPHPTLGWWHIPGATRLWTEEGHGLVHINSLGMRDVERQRSKPSGVFRVAVFGDSMTEAIQVNVDQTFCQLLEQRLRARGRRIEVLNFGVNGYSPLQELLLYEHVGRDFEPDVVLHAIFLDNDVADLHPALASGQRGAPFLVSSLHGDQRVDYTAAEASFRAYHRQPIATARAYLATYRLLSAARWRGVGRQATGGASAAEGIPRRYDLYREAPNMKWGEAWDRLEQVVRDFSQRTRNAEADYVVVSVPAGQLVYPDAWASIQAQYPAMRAEQWNLEAPRARLKALASKYQVPVLDVHEAFLQNRASEPLFFGRVGHLTPAGHRTMASALEAAIERLGSAREH
jgi:hypothetical protein